MTKKTKDKLKTGGLILGSIGGSCACTYACSVLTAICPPVGIAAHVGKFVIGSLIAEKAAAHVYNVIDSTVTVVEEVKPKFDEALEGIRNETETETVEETA